MAKGRSTLDIQIRECYDFTNRFEIEELVSSVPLQSGGHRCGKGDPAEAFRELSGTGRLGCREIRCRLSQFCGELS